MLIKTVIKARGRRLIIVILHLTIKKGMRYKLLIINELSTKFAFCMLILNRFVPGPKK